MDESQTLRVILKQNNNSLYIHDVVHFRLPHSEDYWIIEKVNNQCVFINKKEVVAIGFNKDMG